MQSHYSSGARRHSRAGGAPKNRSFASGRQGQGRGRSKATIHPSRFINRATERVEQPAYVPTHSFADFALNTQTQQTLTYLGLTTPSAIQDQAIKPILEGRDLIGLANTGTGKTAAFLLPIIEHLTQNRDRNSVLILAPTRELAQQIDAEFKRFSAGQKLYSVVCVGGANITPQIRDIRRNPHVIIGTPGRIKDLIARRVLILNGMTMFVLDEADRMLDMGFVRDIRMIAELLPNERQTLCFSATITPAISEIVQSLMRDPLTVSVRSSETNDHIHQDVIEATSKEHKIELLEDLLRRDEYEKVLVFGETKFGVQRLADKLSNSNLPAVAIHGNKSQSQRERALKDFKTETVKIMVATDVAARGLDIPDVTHVINFDQPQTYEEYVHRIGRTGRAGKTGTALTFVSPRY